MNAASAEQTRIAMDVTALLGPRTGVGAMVAELAARLPAAAAAGAGPASDPDRAAEFEFTGYVVSLRGRSRLGRVLPPGWAARPLPYPARAAHVAWLHSNRPSIDGGRVGAFDVVHGPNYVVPPASRAARLVTVHDLTAWRFPELVDTHSRRFPHHLRRAIAEGAHVHAVSYFVAAELEHELGVPGDRIHVVRNGFTRTGRARGPDVRTGRPYVLALGTVEPRKDHVSLVRAMVELWARQPDLTLVIAGADGWGTRALDEEIERLGVGERIERLGYVNETRKADLLAGAELLAFPSRYEGFGLPILEAMAAGVPVVSTTAGAIPEVAGGAAVLVEPGDVSALAEAMAAAIEDDGLRHRLIREGKRRVFEFSWDSATGELLTLYGRLAGSRFARR